MVEVCFHHEKMQSIHVRRSYFSFHLKINILWALTHGTCHQTMHAPLGDFRVQCTPNILSSHGQLTFHAFRKLTKTVLRYSTHIMT